MKFKFIALIITFFFIFCAASFAQEDDYADRGDEYFSRGDFDKALEMYEKALEEDPEDSDILLKMGNVYLEKGIFEDAIVYYEKAIKEDSEMYEAYLNMSRAFRGMGDMEKALASANKAAEFESDEAEVYIQLGNIHFDMEEFDSALEFYNRAVDIDDENPEAYFQRGMAYLRYSEIKEKDSFLEKSFLDFLEVLSLDSDYPLGHFAKGLALFRKGSLDEAYDEFTVETEKSGFSSAYHYLGKIYFEMDRPLKALEEYQKAVEADPLGEHLDIEEFNNDVLRAQEALKEDSADGSDGNTDTEPAENEGIDSSNIQAVVYYNEATKFFSQREFEKAKEEFLKALGEDPGYGRAYYNLGLTYEELGEWDNAIEAYENALSIKKDYENALFAFSIALKKKSEREGNVELLYPVIDHLILHQEVVSPSSNKFYLARDALVEANFKLGKYFKDLGDKEKALEHFNSCLELMEENDARANTVKKQIEEMGL